MISNEIILNTIIGKAKQEKDTVRIRARFGNEYDRPETIILKGKKKKPVIPDLVISYKTKTDLYLIEQDTNYDIKKWRLLSLYALKKQGNFYIVAPKDNESYISRKLEDSMISARIICFSEWGWFFVFLQAIVKSYNENATNYPNIHLFP